ncbi:MAG: PQQ-binding-like beta-propeller repeat protein, partial [Opitutae bacterium]
MKIFLCLLLPVLGIFPLWAEERLVQFSEPKPLSAQAVTSDWPRFNGPGDDARSIESPLVDDWPAGGPRLLWSLEKGDGYASPAVSGEMMVLFHRRNGQEVVEARNARSGNRVWEFSYPVEYQDRYGYSPGPRASPVISDGLVYVHGVTAWLTCLELKSGKLVWQRDLTKEYEVPRYFFGKGSNPIISGDVVI